MPRRCTAGSDPAMICRFPAECPDRTRSNPRMLAKQKKLQLSPAQRDSMRQAGRVNAQLIDAVREIVVAGKSTAAIDRFVHDWTFDHGYRPATLGYQKYPRSCCTSVNNVICHGIPERLRTQSPATSSTSTSRRSWAVGTAINPRRS